MNESLESARAAPEEVREVMSPEQKTRQMNILRRRAEIAESDIFKEIREGISNTKHDLYVAVADAVEVYAIYRFQGALQILQSLLDGYDNARNELEALEADIGAED